MARASHNFLDIYGAFTEIALISLFFLNSYGIKNERTDLHLKFRVLSSDYEYLTYQISCIYIELFLRHDDHKE